MARNISEYELAGSLCQKEEEVVVAKVGAFLLLAFRSMARGEDDIVAAGFAKRYQTA